MEYKGWDITKGGITLSNGIEVHGWMVSKGNRRTITESKEIACRYIDCMEGKKNESCNNHR